MCIFYFSPPGKNSCLVTSSNEVPRFVFRDLGVFFFVTWVNILSNMFILIVVMETTRTNHKKFPGGPALTQLYATAE
jgi:hypothetical protein